MYGHLGFAAGAMPFVSSDEVVPPEGQR